MSDLKHVPAVPPPAHTASPAPLAADSDPSQPLIPVVGIGASAGGLEPICQFLSAVPAGSGMAYVVVQHLSPEHIGALPQLLQRATAMPVREACNGMRIAPDCVYVIPPNAELTLSRHALVVAKPSQKYGARLPIDILFMALAQEYGELATGVVLSGMGMDGTRGLRAIQEAGGLAMAQLPESAQFDPMPLHAIKAGVADIVDVPAQMPCQILDWANGYRPPQLLRESNLARRGALGELLAMLHQQTGNDFSDYKMNTVMRRIERRVNLHGLKTLVQYVKFVRTNPPEVALLFKEMLIGVTSLFRDQRVWDDLKGNVLPNLLADHPDGADFKAWVPACSTGEEAYSLAIVFNEVLAERQPGARYTLQIFATDLDPDAIERARHGLFPRSVETILPPERLRRCFSEEDHGYRIRKEVRNMIIFAQQNVISDPPFTKLDLLSCRNLLIYFSAKLQQQLIPLFHYALKPGGHLILGNADTPGQFSELFAALSSGSRIYKRLEAHAQRRLTCFPSRAALAAPAIPYETRSVTMNGNLQMQVEQQLLKKHSPASVLISKEGDILYIHGRTGAFLEPAAGKANWNIHAMAREPLRYELDDLLRRAAQGDGQELQRAVLMLDVGGQPRQLEMTAEPLSGDDGLAETLLLTFTTSALPESGLHDHPAPPGVAELEQQLLQARLELRAMREEMQTSREELRSANEELQSTNEELQSTNEELTTSKEEMQSLNEELYTLNAELQAKVDDLSQVNSDMKNLLNSTDIATIFLDNALHIRRFTTPATQLYKLIASDVQRPLSDIVNDLEYPELERDALEVLRTLMFSEKQVAARDGRWFTVRIMPYRTTDNVIDGVVLTFINITEAKRLEAQLQALQGGR
jgi:two-component system CheB/CheR fusion protein